LALSYDAVRQVAIDHETFSSERGYGNTLRIAFGKTLMSMDEPEHGRYKRLVLPSFSHRMVTDGLAKIAQPIIDTCLDQGLLPRRLDVDEVFGPARDVLGSLAD